jgi:hypothetical protein
MAEDAAREMPELPLEHALQLVHLYAERSSPKYERAALRWLRRYLDERSPMLKKRRGGRSGVRRAGVLDGGRRGSADDGPRTIPSTISA